MMIRIMALLLRACRTPAGALRWTGAEP
jgi:hypothetical protein